MVKKTAVNPTVPSPFKRVLPPALKVGRDKLELRLDFYHEAIVMQTFDGIDQAFKIVSPHDLAAAVADDMNYGTGLLPENTLWWNSGKSGPVTAIWTAPQIRKLALQTKDVGKPERFDVPLPGLLFLCSPGKAPMVFAVKKRPSGPKDKVFKAPLANVYDNGRSCGGNNRYPDNAGEIPDSFLRSFFTPHADIRNRSIKCPSSIIDLWKAIDGQPEFPLDDLVYHGTIADLLGYAP